MSHSHTLDPSMSKKLSNKFCVKKCYVKNSLCKKIRLNNFVWLLPHSAKLGIQLHLDSSKSLLATWGTEWYYFMRPTHPPRKLLMNSLSPKIFVVNFFYQNLLMGFDIIRITLLMFTPCNLFAVGSQTLKKPAILWFTYR